MAKALPTVDFTIYVRNNIDNLIRKHGSSNKAYAELIGLNEKTFSRYYSRMDALPLALIEKICKYEKIDKNELLHTDMFGVIDKYEPYTNQYYMYSYVTHDNKIHENLFDEYIIKINKTDVECRIAINKGKESKLYIGSFHISNDFLNFTLKNTADENIIFMMLYNHHIRPHDRYLGGLGIAVLPTDSEKKFNTHKVIISICQLKINNKYSNDERRDKDIEFLKKHLRIRTIKNKTCKASKSDDEQVFNYIYSLLLG